MRFPKAIYLPKDISKIVACTKAFAVLCEGFCVDCRGDGQVPRPKRLKNAQYFQLHSIDAKRIFASLIGRGQAVAPTLYIFTLLNFE
jgi:hypothetical protein